MNEPITPESETVAVRKKRKLFLPIAAGIVALSLLAFFASRAGLDKALVKQKLDEAIVVLKEKGRANGRDIDVTYGDLEVVGRFSDQHVVIHQPVLTIKPIAAANTPVDAAKPSQGLRVTTDSIIVYSEAVDLSALRVSLPNLVQVAGLDAPEKALLKFASDTPFEATIIQDTRQGVPYTKITHRSPKTLTLTFLREEQAQGAEDTTPHVLPVYETFTATMAEGSGIESDLAADGSGLGQLRVSYKQFVITPQGAGPEGLITIEDISGHWASSLDAAQRNHVEAQMNVGPLTANNALVPYAPVVLAFDGLYEGTPTKPAEAKPGVPAPESILKINKLLVSTKDASLSANADFTANASDTLPVGRANITFKNIAFVLAELHKAGVLDESNDASLNAILEQISGTPAASLTDLDIPIERTRGGAFKIGQTTFEELVAKIIRSLVTAKENAAIKPGAPQLPGDKPRPAPVAIPDHGARG